MIQTNKPLTTGQVAALFCVTRTTVQRWAALGLIPAYRTPGGQLRFPADAIARTYAEQFTPGTAPAYDAIREA